MVSIANIFWDDRRTDCIFYVATRRSGKGKKLPLFGNRFDGSWNNLKSDTATHDAIA